MSTNGQLNPDDIRILQMLANGDTYTEIAEKLGRKKNAVATKVYRIRDKLSTQTTVHCVAEAMRRGYIR